MAEHFLTREKTMSKRFATVLWLCAAPLFAQNGPPAMQMSGQMPGMSTEKSPTPVAQLLEGVATRAPRKLEDFLAMADKNNPTLQQAEAIVRRSEAQAKQA